MTTSNMDISMVIEPTTKQGYIKTKLGWIPQDWEVKKLGTLGKVISGLTYSPNDIDKKGVLVLRSSNVQNGQLSFDDNVYVNVDSNNYNPVKKDDILICVRNGSKSLIGKSALITSGVEGMAFGAFMSVFRSSFNKYIYQLFYTDVYNREIQRNLGATINSINGSNLKNFSFPFPPLLEQTAIANCLSTWDNAIQNLTALIAQKELLKKALMQQLLTGKTRLKGFEGEWKSKRIEDFSKQVSLKNTDDKDMIVLSCTKYDGLVPSLEYFGRQIYSDKLYTYKIVKKGQFAYATNHIEEGSIGYQSDYQEALISPMYTVFKTNDSINDSYFYRILKSHALIHEYNKRMEGSIDRRGGLRWKGFSKIKVNVPPLEEQTAIDQVLQCADNEIKLLNNKLTQLQAQKKGLMQQLLMGKKRLTQI